MNGVPVPAMSTALSFYDGYRSEWLPANLIQAQRDFFGAHMYERVDRKRVTCPLCALTHFEGGDVPHELDRTWRHHGVLIIQRVGALKCDCE